MFACLEEGYTPRRFAKIIDTKPAGGRGISDFSRDFFFVPEVFPWLRQHQQTQRPEADGAELLTVSRELLQERLSLDKLYAHTVLQ